MWQGIPSSPLDASGDKGDPPVSSRAIWAALIADRLRARSKKEGVYEFLFFNDKTLEKVAVCVDGRLPTEVGPESCGKKQILFAASSQGQCLYVSSLEMTR